MPALGVLAVAAALANAQPFDLHGAATPPLQQGALVRGRVPAGTPALTLDGKPVAVAPDGSNSKSRRLAAKYDGMSPWKSR